MTEKKKPFIQKSDDELVRLPTFVQEVFDLKLYAWQRRVLSDLDQSGSRVALKAANGSGKTARCIAPSVLWHALMFPNSVCVTTSGVYRQVKEQMWPTIRSLSTKVAEFGIEINATDLRVRANNSRIVGFSTDDPGRFEGFHADNLLIAIDEAKSVKDEIFQAVERCQPNRMLVASSPGPNTGEFYRIFTKYGDLYKKHTVTAHDCPHIEKTWIEAQIKRWGNDHPFIRSMIYGEFMQTTSEALVVTYDQYLRCKENPPIWDRGKPIAGVDFAAGSDENVVAVKEGNRITRLVCWTERDTMAAVGRFIMEFKKANLRPEDIYCDEGGIGRPMADALADAGWKVNRVQFGGTPQNKEAYDNRGTEIWMETGRQIDRGEIILPDDEVLMMQLTSRQVKSSRRGKIMLESKEELANRGINSPDRADAVCLVAGIGAEADYMRQITSPSLAEMLEGMTDQLQSDPVQGIFCG